MESNFCNFILPNTWVFFVVVVRHLTSQHMKRKNILGWGYWYPKHGCSLNHRQLNSLHWLKSACDKKQKSNTTQVKKPTEEVIRKNKHPTTTWSWGDTWNNRNVHIFVDHKYPHSCLIVKEAKKMDCSFSACSTAVLGCIDTTTEGFPLLGLVSCKPIHFPHYLILPSGRARKHTCFLIVPRTICSFTFGKMVSTFKSLLH